jgi:uncharacterized protein
MLLTDELFLYYQRCHRRAFLEVYGDLDRRESPSDYLRKLHQDSQHHQRQILKGQEYHQPHSPNRDRKTAAIATLDLMQQGVERIYQGTLLTEGQAGLTLLSQPDLLIKRSGKSVFGDWLYEPIEIKLGKRPKLEYQTTVAYHTQVLAAVQGAWPETVWLLLREKGLFAVPLADVLPRMQGLLQECIQMLHQTQEPEVFIARSRCNLCHWFNHCYTIAQEQQHLSLLPGVTPNRYSHLQALNLTTLTALANTPAPDLESLPGFGAEVARKLVRQAQSAVQNQAIPTPVPTGSQTSSIAPQPLPAMGPLGTLPTTAVELYFDIEAEPERNLVYLHGVLVVDRQAQTERFYPFLAEEPASEGTVWRQFLELVWDYPEAPIFHFCPYEVQTVKRLGQLYETSWRRIQQLLPRFVDLHAWVTQTVTLPVESYALKPIARWLGFNWSDPKSSGAQSIYWYSQWLATGDRTFLDQILRYNEDDCRATFHVKNWLTNFLQTQD